MGFFRSNAESMPFLPSKVILALGLLLLLYFHCNGRSRTITVILPSEFLPDKITQNPPPANATKDSLIFTGTWSPTDEEVLKYLKEKHLFPPSKAPYNLVHNLAFLAQPSKQVPVFESVGNKQNGFFIECGANDGEFLTNTLGLESNLGWNGLLVESSPSLFQKLKTKNRKAWLADVCLSGKIEQIEFLKSTKTDKDWRIGNGKINPGDKYQKPKKWGTEEFKMEDYASEGMVDCFPLISVLTAINVTTVDFFSLDVEGHEFRILKAIPFDKIDIKVILVEHWLAPEGKETIQSFMLEKGYIIYYSSASDFIFKKKEISIV